MPRGPTASASASGSPPTARSSRRSRRRSSSGSRRASPTCSREAEGDVAIAVSLLFAFANAAHERRLAAFLEERFPGVPVVVSHRAAPVWREHERTTTTIVDAYLSPSRAGSPASSRRVSRRAASSGPVSIMKSNGGRMLAAATGAQAVQTVLSGLSGGIVAGRHFGLAAGARDVVTFDMGGTSADIGLVRDGEIQYVPDFELEFGLPIATPAIDLVTIGAGGGSIAWVDDGGLLRVGPRSAGAVPGPACYGLGGAEPTVTDANLVLGRIDPGSFLDGRLRLDPGRAHEALAELGRACRSRRRRGRRGGDRDRERGHGRHDPPRRGRARRRSARLRARRLRRRRPAPRGRDRRLARHGGRDRAAAPGARLRVRHAARRPSRRPPLRRTTRARTSSTSRRSPTGSKRWSDDARAALAEEGFAGEPAGRAVAEHALRRPELRARRAAPARPPRRARARERVRRVPRAPPRGLRLQLPGRDDRADPRERGRARPGRAPGAGTLPEGELPAPRAVRDVRFAGERASHAGLPARGPAGGHGAPRPGRGRGARLDDARPSRPGAARAPRRDPAALRERKERRRPARGRRRHGERDRRPARPDRAGDGHAHDARRLLPHLQRVARLLVRPLRPPTAG